jgi:hypothetical protein
MEIILVISHQVIHSWEILQKVYCGKDVSKVVRSWEVVLLKTKQLSILDDNPALCCGHQCEKV